MLRKYLPIISGILLPVSTFLDTQTAAVPGWLYYEGPPQVHPSAASSLGPYVSLDTEEERQEAFGFSEREQGSYNWDEHYRDIWNDAGNDISSEMATGGADELYPWNGPYAGDKTVEQVNQTGNALQVNVATAATINKCSTFLNWGYARPFSWESTSRSNPWEQLVAILRERMEEMSTTRVALQHTFAKCMRAAKHFEQVQKSHIAPNSTYHKMVTYKYYAPRRLSNAGVLYESGYATLDDTIIVQPPSNGKRKTGQIYFKPEFLIVLTHLSTFIGWVGVASLCVRMIEKKIKWMTRMIIMTSFGQAFICAISLATFFTWASVRELPAKYSEAYFYCTLACLASFLSGLAASYHHYLNRSQVYSYTLYELSFSQRQLILLSTASMGYICLSSGFYSYLEGWEFDYSIYFSVTTLSTIGFGDFAPKTMKGKICLPFVAIVGIGIIAGTIYSIRLVTLEFMTHRLATAYSKSFGFEQDINGNSTNGISNEDRIELPHSGNSSRLYPGTSHGGHEPLSPYPLSGGLDSAANTGAIQISEDADGSTHYRSAPRRRLNRMNSMPAGLLSAEKIGYNVSSSEEGNTDDEQTPLIKSDNAEDTQNNLKGSTDSLTKLDLAAENARPLIAPSISSESSRQGESSNSPQLHEETIEEDELPKLQPISSIKGKKKISLKKVCQATILDQLAPQFGSAGIQATSDAIEQDLMVDHRIVQLHSKQRHHADQKPPHDPSKATPNSHTTESSSTQMNNTNNSTQSSHSSSSPTATGETSTTANSFTPIRHDNSYIPNTNNSNHNGLRLEVPTSGRQRQATHPSAHFLDTPLLSPLSAASPYMGGHPSLNFDDKTALREATMRRYFPRQDTMTISRSQKLPSLTIVTGGQVGRHQVLETTRKAFQREIGFATFTVVSTLLIFGGVFSYLEEWTYFEGIYFTFVALTTIGYGDYCPDTVSGRSFFVWFIFIGIGALTYFLSIVSEIALDKWTMTVNRIGRRVDRYEKKAKLKKMYRNAISEMKRRKSHDDHISDDETANESGIKQDSRHPNEKSAYGRPNSSHKSNKLESIIIQGDIRDTIDDGDKVLSHTSTKDGLRSHSYGSNKSSSARQRNGLVSDDSDNDINNDGDVENTDTDVDTRLCNRNEPRIQGILAGPTILEHPNQSSSSTQPTVTYSGVSPESNRQPKYHHHHHHLHNKHRRHFSWASPNTSPELPSARRGHKSTKSGVVVIDLPYSKSYNTTGNNEGTMSPQYGSHHDDLMHQYNMQENVVLGPSKEHINRYLIGQRRMSSLKSRSQQSNSLTGSHKRYKSVGITSPRNGAPGKIMKRHPSFGTSVKSVTFGANVEPNRGLSVNTSASSPQGQVSPTFSFQMRRQDSFDRQHMESPPTAGTTTPSMVFPLDPNYYDLTPRDETSDKTKNADMSESESQQQRQLGTIQSEYDTTFAHNHNSSKYYSQKGKGALQNSSVPATNLYSMSGTRDYAQNSERPDPVYYLQQGRHGSVSSSESSVDFTNSDIETVEYATMDSHGRPRYNDRRESFEGGRVDGRHSHLTHRHNPNEGTPDISMDQDFSAKPIRIFSSSGIKGWSSLSKSLGTIARLNDNRSSQRSDIERPESRNKSANNSANHGTNSSSVTSTSLSTFSNMINRLRGKGEDGDSTK